MWDERDRKEMILWKSKEELETRPTFPCRAFRWVLNLSNYGIELIHQYQFKDRSDWCFSHTSRYGINVTKKYQGFGSSHFYYDGPHCLILLGWLTIQYVNNNCKKCYEDLG